MSEESNAGGGRIREPGMLVFYYTETPLHAGSGTGIGAIDLPIQRERMSGLPIVQGSGIKGAWREAMRQRVGRGAARDSKAGDGKGADLVLSWFGPEPPRVGDGEGKTGEAAPTFAGCVSLGDARLLLLAVRTLKGGWAWVTCPLILERLVRDLEILGMELPGWVSPGADLAGAWVSKGAKSAVVSEGRLVIEDFDYAAEEREEVDRLGEFLRERAFPDTPSYAPFRDRIPGQLAVLPDEELLFLAHHATEVVARIRMDGGTGTVAKGALWSEESIPAESFLWSLGTFTGDRRPGEEAGAGAMRRDFVAAARECARIRLGGDRTVGRGVVGVRVYAPGAETEGSQP
ncbi:type III-B CRISPR module RAMP protein Cmr4 [Myxococcota bacterium]|nr:type III-B CRISPR module RAMP protein Cmr4 [Myxococcota bacterium]